MLIIVVNGTTACSRNICGSTLYSGGQSLSYVDMLGLDRVQLLRLRSQSKGGFSCACGPREASIITLLDQS